MQERLLWFPKGETLNGGSDARFAKIYSRYQCCRQRSNIVRSLLKKIVHRRTREWYPDLSANVAGSGCLKNGLCRCRSACRLCWSGHASGRIERIQRLDNSRHFAPDPGVGRCARREPQDRENQCDGKGWPGCPRPGYSNSRNWPFEVTENRWEVLRLKFSLRLQHKRYC